MELVRNVLGYGETTFLRDLSMALTPLDCQLHEARTNAELLGMLRQSRFEALVIHPFGLSQSARLALEKAASDPAYKVILACNDKAAAGFGDSACVTVALPLETASLAFALGAEKWAEDAVKRFRRVRISLPASILLVDNSVSACVVALTPHGGVLNVDCFLDEGSVVLLSVVFGEEEFKLAGTVRACLKEQSSYQITVGFFSQSYLEAKRLYAAVLKERSLMRLSVVAIPSVPRPVADVFMRFGVVAEEWVDVPPALTPRPFLVIADLNRCDVASLKRLSALKSRSVILGIVADSLQPDKTAIANQLEYLFVLPHHVSRLQDTVVRLLMLSEQKFPRFQDEFEVLINDRQGHQEMLCKGLDFSLEGCAFLAQKAMRPGNEFSGIMFLGGTVRGFPFVGQVVYSKPFGGGFRVGAKIRVLATHRAAFDTFLQRRFEAELRNHIRYSVEV